MELEPEYGRPGSTVGVIKQQFIILDKKKKKQCDENIQFKVLQLK